MDEIRLSKRAQRDLRAVDARQRRRIQDALAGLEHDQRSRLDIRAVRGHPPWMRLRVGDWRILYCRREGSGWLVGRVVDRQHLKRAIATLETLELD